MGGTTRARLALAMVIGLLGALIGVHPAAAHNSLVSSDPKNGAQLSRPPAVIRLTFLSRLDPASTKVTLTGPDGRGAQGGAPRFDGSRVSIPFAPGPAGRYTISYRIVSSDGHPVTGAVRFTLIRPAAPATGARSATASAASPVASRAVSAPPSSAAAATGSATMAGPAAANARDDRSTLWLAVVVAGLLAALIGGALVVRRYRRGGHA